MFVNRSIGVLISVSTLATVVWGSSCPISSDTLGECVELKECSKWNQMLDRSYISKSEFKLFNEALEACAGNNGLGPKQVCCDLKDIYKKKVDVEPLCLLGASNATQSDRTSFGVFLFIKRQEKSRRCVGSLIEAGYVLTSAQCVQNATSENIAVYINAKYVYNGENGAVGHGVKRSQVESVIVHNEYSKGQLGFDVALLRLKERVDFDSPGSPYPICIPTAKEHYESDNSILHSFGWGQNAEGVFSDTKLSVTLQRITLPQCSAENYGGRLGVKVEVLEESNSTNPICTIGISGHNLFKGYSGAPLMYRKKGAWFLLGVVGKPLNPDEKREGDEHIRVLSTSVQRQAKWIKDVLKDQRSPEAGIDERINPT